MRDGLTCPVTGVEFDEGSISELAHILPFSIFGRVSITMMSLCS